MMLVLITVYLEKSHQEIDRLVHELHEKDKEIEQLQHDSFLELEKVYTKFSKLLRLFSQNLAIKNICQKLNHFPVT